MITGGQYKDELLTDQSYILGQAYIVRLSRKRRGVVLSFNHVFRLLW